MKDHFRLFRRGWGTFYVEDTQTGKQQSLQTTDKREAQRLVHARNEAQNTPLVNLAIAKAYLAASDPALTARTWQDVLTAIRAAQMRLPPDLTNKLAHANHWQARKTKLSPHANRYRTITQDVLSSSDDGHHAYSS